MTKKSKFDEQFQDPVPSRFLFPLAEIFDLKTKIYLKREDLLHGGAHKTNQVLGQALLTKRMGKKRVIAETGAGQHGVATALACALLGLEARIYMGQKDIERQQPNVFRMKLMGAQVIPVTAGSGTLKDAVNEAMRDWVTNIDDIKALAAVADQGILGAITGRAIYEGTLDVAEAQQLCDSYQ